MLKVQILPSLLAADMGNIAGGARLAEMAGGDALHVDIMDGHFVPNISMGPATVAAVRRATTFPLSVHLMLSRPDKYVKRFAEAGSHRLMIHVEAECDVMATLEEIRSLNVVPGITLNPATPADKAFPFLDAVDEVLCMTVPPGYGGQEFVSSVLPKIRLIRNEAKRRKKDLDIMVDGGIDLKTAPLCAHEGANAYVAGTSLYRAADMAADIRRMREAVAASLVV